LQFYFTKAIDIIPLVPIGFISQNSSKNLKIILTWLLLANAACLSFHAFPILTALAFWPLREQWRARIYYSSADNVPKKREPQAMRRQNWLEMAETKTGKRENREEG
jgi:hypothetical protein